MEAAAPPDLLHRIAGVVQKESIGSALRALRGAELKDDLLVLDLTPVNEFFRRQIKENTSVITQAASQVAGRPVTISFLQGLASPVKAASASAPVADVLERAKREPIVQAFLDRFPGPVKAEEIDSNE